MCDLRFDVSLHPLPGGAISGPPLVDPRGTWPTIVPPTDAAGMTMTSDFDAALERLGALERAFVEPDGSFVWVGPGGRNAGRSTATRTSATVMSSSWRRKEAAPRTFSTSFSQFGAGRGRPWPCSWCAPECLSMSRPSAVTPRRMVCPVEGPIPVTLAGGRSGGADSAGGKAPGGGRLFRRRTDSARCLAGLPIRRMGRKPRWIVRHLGRSLWAWK